MSSVEITQAAMLSLKAKALESYGIIKDLLSQPPKEGVANEIASEALKLVQYEGAALTLNQYFGKGLPSEEGSTLPEEPAPAQKEDKTIVVTEEMSPTYKRAIQKEKIKATASKRRAKKEKKNEE